MHFEAYPHVCQNGVGTGSTIWRRRLRWGWGGHQRLSWREEPSTKSKRRRWAYIKLNKQTNKNKNETPYIVNRPARHSLRFTDSTHFCTRLFALSLSLSFYCLRGLHWRFFFSIISTRPLYGVCVCDSEFFDRWRMPISQRHFVVAHPRVRVWALQTFGRFVVHRFYFDFFIFFSFIICFCLPCRIFLDVNLWLCGVCGVKGNFYYLIGWLLSAQFFSFSPLLWY